MNVGDDEDEVSREPLDSTLGSLIDGENADQVRVIFGSRSVDSLAESIRTLVDRHRGTEIVGCSSATLAFADAYAKARNRRWSRDEWAVIHAALVYRLGYQARCQHALGGGPAIERLVRFAEALRVV